MDKVIMVIVTFTGNGEFNVMASLVEPMVCMDWMVGTNETGGLEKSLGHTQVAFCSDPNVARRTVPETAVIPAGQT